MPKTMMTALLVVGCPRTIVQLWLAVFGKICPAKPSADFLRLNADSGASRSVLPYTTSAAFVIPYTSLGVRIYFVKYSQPPFVLRSDSKYFQPDRMHVIPASWSNQFIIIACPYVHVVLAVSGILNSQIPLQTQ